MGLSAHLQPKILKTFTIPVYGHVHILWTYQEAKIHFWLFTDFFSLIVSLQYLKMIQYFSWLLINGGLMFCKNNIVLHIIQSGLYGMICSIQMPHELCCPSYDTVWSRWCFFLIFAIILLWRAGGGGGGEVVGNNKIWSYTNYCSGHNAILRCIFLA